MLMAAGRTTSTGVATDATALHVASTTPIVSERAGTGPAVAAATLDSASTPPTVCSAPLCRLPQVHAFSATEGDWMAFHLRFKAEYRSIKWSEHEALRALPTALDDDSLAAFYSIPEADRSSLASACAAMAALYAPPSTIRKKFQLRKWGDTDSPLAFHSALLALRRAAYPSMDRAALDSLALERRLTVAKELGNVLSVTADDNLSSLQVAKNIPVHLGLREEPAATVCTMVEGDSMASDSSTGYATRSSSPRHAEMRGGRSPVGWPPRRGPLRGYASHGCYYCGRTGHITSNCQLHVGDPPGAPATYGVNFSSSRGPQAFHDTSCTWPFHSHHSSASCCPVTTHPDRLYDDSKWCALAYRAFGAAPGSSDVMAFIQGVEVRVVIDTGASATLISLPTFRSFPASPRPLEQVLGLWVE
ncbi:uncharacterized protein LOC116947623 [Petromyzon marinus]|uniref:Uncharacterized protein LOC116947623 n=1 Tax=Petromyzon marinus TaxID=7757 RepID=A0AAJ7TKD1_PETMA|nr:uncharacterized protein LOC116947623 [Petromyzon marinus]XP_032819475.1 uncharacterized protein LOC116947623 [Petromyzon marinus]XP_032819477.1 uncharacterized protein LOC116947623 [Petromyzon marinus]